MDNLKEFLEGARCCSKSNPDGRGVEETMRAMEVKDDQTMRYVKVMIENPEWFRKVERLVNQNDYSFGYLNCNLPKVVGTLKDMMRSGISPSYDYLLEALNIRSRDEYEPLEFAELFRELQMISLTNQEVEQIMAHVMVRSLEYDLVRLTNNSFDMLSDLINEFHKEKARVLPDVERLTEILDNIKERVTLYKEIQGTVNLEGDAVDGF